MPPRYLKLWSTRIFSRRLIKRVEAMGRRAEEPPVYDIDANSNTSACTE